MPRPPIDSYWVERIHELTENNPQLGSSKMSVRLQEEAKRLGRDDWPSEKACRNYKAKHKDLPEHERRQYRFVYWPESFGTPELPWEASPAVLEVLRFCGGDDRPTVRVAKWYWRVSLVTPQMPPKDRLNWARTIAAVEVSGLPLSGETMRGFEWKLIHPGEPMPDVHHIYTTIDAAEREGLFSPAVAKQLREAKERRKSRKEDR